MSMKWFLRSMIVCGIAATAFGAPQQIPTSLLGQRYVDQFNFPSLLGSFPAGYGGAFNLNVYTGTTKASETPATATRATIWCVDYQLDVTNGSNYLASIVQLTDTAGLADTTKTRYADVVTSNTSTNPRWVNDLGAGYNTAASRYALAATLINQYSTIDAPTNNATNRAIQSAIWTITLNTSAAIPDTNGSIAGNQTAFADIATGKPSGYTDWVDYAKTNVLSSSALAGWAVLSGPAPIQVSPVGNYQTFLVQLRPLTDTNVPEPGFYGMLAIGLSGLFVGVRRRRAA